MEESESASHVGAGETSSPTTLHRQSQPVETIYQESNLGDHESAEILYEVPVLAADTANNASSQGLSPEETQLPFLLSIPEEEEKLHLSPPASSKSAGFISQWTFEIAAMAMSAGALVAIAAVLLAFDGKPMSTWRAFIRPNTVVSALSTLSKSSMLMVVGQGLGQLKWQHFQQRPRRLIDFEILDGASRGPMGAVQLLYRLKWRALAACVGAVITVLAIAMDPFVQQVIYYDSHLVPASNVSSVISRAQSYDMGSTWEGVIDAATRGVYSKSLLSSEAAGIAKADKAKIASGIPGSLGRCTVAYSDPTIRHHTTARPVNAAGSPSKA
jgi:hypothetical protein